MTFAVSQVLEPSDNWEVTELEGPALAPDQVGQTLGSLAFARKLGRQVLFICELTPRASLAKAMEIGLEGDDDRVALESPAGTDDLTARLSKRGVPVERSVGKVRDDEPVRLGLLCDSTEATQVTIDGRSVGVIPATVSADAPLKIIGNVLEAGDVAKIMVATEIEEIHSNSLRRSLRRS